MNIIINFATLKSGGGQNVGLNFLESMKSVNTDDFQFYFVVARNSGIHKYVLDHDYENYTVVPNNPLLRMFYELFLGRKLVNKLNIDIIYSYFGLGLYPKRILQVTGSADSNLYFPEINFWVEYKGLKLFKRKIVDFYRIWGLKRANGIIFENESLEKRCHQIFKLNNTIFIRPSINLDFASVDYNIPIQSKNDVPKGLFLCGWQRNKNIMLIPEIAAKLKESNKSFHFIITAPLDNSPDHLEFIRLTKKFNVGDMVTVIGQVKKEELASLYQQIDYVFLLSKLESFSNNIIESWYFEKPLIVSDELWARSICKEGAIYVNRNSVSDITENLIRIMEQKDYRLKILENSKNILKSYPSIEQKTKEELTYLRYVFENN